MIGKLVKELERSNIFATEEAGHAFLNAWMSKPTVAVRRTVYHGSANFVGRKLTICKFFYGHLCASNLILQNINNAAL